MLSDVSSPSAEAVAAHPHPAHVRRSGQGEHLRQRVVGVGRVASTTSSVPPSPADPDRVELPPHRQVADLRRRGPAPPRRPGSPGTAGAPASAAGPSAPSSDCTKYACNPSRSSEKPCRRRRPCPAPPARRARRGGAAGTGRCPARCCSTGSARRRPGRGEQVQLGVAGMHVVRQHAAPAEQPAPVVGVGVVACSPGRGRGRSSISAGFSLTCEVNSAPSTSRSTAAHDSSIASLADSEKRGRDGVAQPVRAVLPCQRAASARASAYACSGVVSSSGRSSRSLTTSPALIRRPTSARPLEQESTAAGEVRAEHQCRRRPGAQQAVDELARHRPRVRRRRPSGPPRAARTPIEPVEQRHAEPADHPHLREVHVGVDEAGQHDAAGQVDDLVVRARRPDAGERPAVDDDAVGDGEPAVLLGAQATAVERRVGGVQDRAAVDRHDDLRTRAARARTAAPGPRRR